MRNKPYVWWTIQEPRTSITSNFPVTVFPPPPRRDRIRWRIETLLKRLVGRCSCGERAASWGGYCDACHEYPEG